jgi:hypothetical protein
MAPQAFGRGSQELTGGNCDPELPMNMRVKRGDVRIWYKNFVGHTLHYRGKIDPTGKIDAWHTNQGGSRSILAGQISGDTANLDLNRGRCYYTVALTKA